MAAGESRRWGEDNKLLADIAGKPMVRRTAEALLTSGVRPVLAVTGHEPDAVAAALSGLDVSCQHAPHYADGMSASLKAGIAAVPEGCDAAMVCLGDMPFVKPDTFDRLATAYDPAGCWMALFPTFDGQRGNPVLLGRPLFAEIMRLGGDQGARALLKAMPERVGEIAVDDPGILRDIDRPEMLAP